MMMKIFLVGLTAFFAVACISKPPKRTLDGLIVEDVKSYMTLNDTLPTSGRAFLLYESASNDLFTVLWGDKRNKTFHQDTLPILASGLPMFDWNNDDVICLRQSCGTACFFAYVFLVKTGEIKRYMYPLAYDKVNNYIACSVDNSNGFLIVENLLTGEKQEIKESYDRQLGPLSISAIDSISFVSDGLYFKWKNSASAIQEKTIVLQ